MNSMIWSACLPTLGRTIYARGTHGDSFPMTDTKHEQYAKDHNTSTKLESKRSMLLDQKIIINELVMPGLDNILSDKEKNM